MVSLHNLSGSFGSFCLQDISFSFPQKSIVSILGKSGSGKTLLLKTIAGLVPSGGGTIFFGEDRLEDLPPHKRKIGFVFQDYALYSHLTTRDNIAFPIKLRKKERKTVDEMVNRTAALLRIPEEHLAKYVNHLPEGIKQLTAIARAKTSAVNLYVLDEPMAHLDSLMKKELRTFIKTLISQLDITAIFSFNDPEDALVISDYIAVLNNGKLEQFGTGNELFNYPASLDVLEQLSVYGLNKLPVFVQNGKTVPFGLPANYRDGDYLLCFRPEAVSFVKSGIPVTITGKHFFSGSKMEVTAETEKNEEISLLVPEPATERFSIMPEPFFLFPETGKFTAPA